MPIELPLRPLPGRPLHRRLLHCRPWRPSLVRPPIWRTTTRTAPSRARPPSSPLHDRTPRVPSSPCARPATGVASQRPCGHDPPGPRARQRHRPARRQGLAPPRPDRRAPGHARVHRSGQHQRLVSERQRGDARSPSARATCSSWAAPRSRSSRHLTFTSANGRLHSEPLGASIGFLVLVYAFFFFVARALWRDLRAGVAGAGRPLARLVVMSARRRAGPQPGASIPLDAVNSIGRDVNNSIVARRLVRVGRARPAHVPRPRLVRRGPRQHQRHVAQRPAHRGPVAAGLRRRGPDRPGAHAARRPRPEPGSDGRGSAFNRVGHPAAPAPARAAACSSWSPSP